VDAKQLGESATDPEKFLQYQQSCSALNRFVFMQNSFMQVAKAAYSNYKEVSNRRLDVWRTDDGTQN
jgi:hypothetical protein